MNCYKLTKLKLKGIKVKSAVNLGYMFANCFSLKSLDFTSFIVSNNQILSFRYMFYNCTSLTSLNLSNFDININYGGYLRMESMFQDCKNLGYLNLIKYSEPNPEYFFYDNILDNTPQNMVICLSDYGTSKLKTIFSNKSCAVLSCDDNWKIKQNLINDEDGNCVDSCSGNFLYNYLNRCQRKCPKGTNETSSKFCEEILAEEDEEEDSEVGDIISTIKASQSIELNLEKESENENNKTETNIENSSVKEIKESYEIEKGKTEIRTENDIEKETDKKDDNNNSDIEINNSYKIKTSIYDVINSVKTNKNSDIIISMEKKSEDNTDIGQTIIMDNSFQTHFMIDNKKINIENTSLSNEYMNICNITSFLNNECKINSQSNIQKEDFFSNLISKITDGSLEPLINSVVEENKNIIIENEDEVYTISTTENQNLNESKTLIDLSGCEKELKKVYNISSEEKIIIFKIEKSIPGYKIPIIGYELFSQNGKINFDIDYCKNIKTNTYISVNLEKEIFKYNPKDEYYNDRCNQFTTENGTDITLFDRKNDYNKNNMSLCEVNCDYKGYDINNRIVHCECGVRNIKFVFEDKKQLLNEFKSVKKIMNLDLIKCYRSLFSLKGLQYNIGSYTIFLLIIISIICSLLFCIKGYSSLVNKIKFIITFKPKVISRNNKKTEAKEEDIEDNDNSNKDKNKSGNTLIRIQERNDINQNNILTLNNINNNNINNPICNNNLNNNNVINNKTIKKKVTKLRIKLNDNEKNSLEYEKAIKRDKRTFFQHYFSLIRTKHLIIFTFFTKSDYNSPIIKIIIFILSFAFFCSINALFFTDSTMHQIYIDHGIYNFIYQLPQIVYSTIISTIIDTVISYLSLTEESVIELKNKNLKEKEDELQKLIKCIYIKYILFFLLNFIFLGFMWYYLATFCAIYKNTQIFLLKDTLLSFGISLIYPFLYNLIPSIFRIPALRAKNKDRHYLYKFSQFLEKF